MKKNILLSLLLIVTTAVSAQQSIRLTGMKKGTDTQVSVANYRVTSTDDKTIVTMDFILDSLNVPSNRYRAFTPVIRTEDGQYEQRFKTLIVSGRRQNIVFEREGIDPLYAANCDNVRRDNGARQKYNYTDGVQSQPWHSRADLFVECDLCGCGDLLKNEVAFLANLKPLDPWEYVTMANQEPDAGKPMRELHGSAYITFVVDRWEMKPDYMDNRRELRKITDTLDIMVADKNVTVNTIKIHGWASPESPYNHNNMLATNRAKSLTEWLRQNYQLPATAFAPAEATPENWIGLRETIEKTGSDLLPHKADIYDMVDNLLRQDSTVVARTADATEARIRASYPQEYAYLLREVYPSLRRSDYEITFNIRQFNTIEECLDIYRTKPHQLSKHELWRVAQTMKPFSNDYNRVMQTALNYYPEDEAVNLNLANVALSQHDLLKAETLLTHAGNSPEALNSRAVIAIVQKRYDEAEALLKQAEQRSQDGKHKDLQLSIAKNREAIKLLKK